MRILRGPIVLHHNSQQTIGSTQISTAKMAEYEKGLTFKGYFRQLANTLKSMRIDLDEN